MLERGALHFLYPQVWLGSPSGLKFSPPYSRGQDVKVLTHPRVEVLLCFDVIETLENINSELLVTDGLTKNNSTTVY